LQQINGFERHFPHGASVAGEYIATNGPTAAGGLFVSVYSDQQHFAYIDFNGNIQDAWYDGAQWHLQQINNNGVTKGPPALAGGLRTGLTSGLFVSVYNNAQHFTYYDATSPGTIWDASFGPVYFNGQDTGLFSWSLQQINNNGRTNGPPAGGNMFVSVYNNQHHFTYVDDTGNIQDAWWDGAKQQWKLQQIYSAGAEVTTGGPFVSVYNGQHHFTFDVIGTIVDKFYDGAQWNWQQIKINGVTDGPAVNGLPFINVQYVPNTLFVSVYDGQQHFTYIDRWSNVLDAFQD
jgi:hypothetical protein